MAINIGIVGLGGMGSFHLRALQNIRGVNIVALCDVDPEKLEGGWQKLELNIGKAGKTRELKNVRTSRQARDLFRDPAIDVIDLTVPTDEHARLAVPALEAGKHVICEKPMAITARDAKRMVAAAKAADRQLFIGHCIRFWPSYVKALEIINGGKYGKLVSANFRRLSATPGGWSRHNWFMEAKKSGLCALDLHIHDADFVLYAFGKPRAVTSAMAGMGRGRADHIITSYDYGKDCLIVAEGAWEYAPGHGFEMSFTIGLEQATLMLGRDGKLMLHPKKGKSKELKVSPKGGHELELRHFIDCLQTGRTSDVVSPESAMQSVRLVELEVQSARTGKRVPVTF